MDSKSNGDLSRKSKRQAKKCAEVGRILVKEEIKARVKQVAYILKKSEDCRTAEDRDILQQSPEIVLSIDKRAKVRDAAKQRVLEVEDDAAVLETKCEELAQVFRDSKNVVIYTGAGISTAASIPDYRGPNGVWTLLQQGKEIKSQDLSDAEPTLTHMAIAQLHHQNIVKYVVSQNCDGLHLRSGLSRLALSEVHGNMFLEVCRDCKPRREYIRLFDVTEKTGVRRHSTGRFCHACRKPLQDTIVHFGEKGGLHSPYNWQETADAVDDCDMILCLGSSLKILRKYACLWCMDLRPKDRPKLYIVNLQWTPKDDLATLKINGKCDDVLRKVMNKLNMKIPKYKRAADPLFKLSTPLLDSESDSISKKILDIPPVIEPNLFSHAAQSLRRLKKLKKRKKAPVKSDCETETCSIEEGVNSNMTDTDSRGSVCLNSTDSVIIVDQIEERLPKPTTSKPSTDQIEPDSPYKLDFPILRQKLGFLTNLKMPFTTSEICNNEKLCTNSTLSVSSVNEMCETEPCKVERDMETSLNFQDIKMKTSAKDQCLKIVSESAGDSGERTLCEDSSNSNLKRKNLVNASDNKTPISPGTSLPGWFGKGFNPRKRKRKL